MTLDTEIKLPAHTMFQEFDDEAVLLDLRTQEHFGLDPIGAFLFKSLQTGLGLRSIHSSLLQEYDVSDKVLEGDMINLLNALQEHGLIEVR